MSNWYYMVIMRITFLLSMGVERPSGRRYLNIARGLVHAGHTVRMLALHPDFANCVVRRSLCDKDV